MYYGAQVMVVLWLFPVGVFIVIPLVLLFIHLAKKLFSQTGELIGRKVSAGEMELSQRMAVETGGVPARHPSGVN